MIFEARSHFPKFFKCFIIFLLLSPSINVYIGHVCLNCFICKFFLSLSYCLAFVSCVTVVPSVLLVSVWFWFTKLSQDLSLQIMFSPLSCFPEISQCYGFVYLLSFEKLKFQRCSWKWVVWKFWKVSRSVIQSWKLREKRSIFFWDSKAASSQKSAT